MHYQSANVSQLVIIICISLYYYNQQFEENKNSQLLSLFINNTDLNSSPINLIKITEQIYPSKVNNLSIH